MALTLLTGLSGETAAYVLPVLRKSLAFERQRDGCVLQSSALDVEMAASLAPLLELGSLSLVLALSSPSHLDSLLADLAQQPPRFLALSCQSAWGSMGLRSTVGQEGQHEWMLDMRRQKQSSGSSAGFAAAVAAIRTALVVEQDGRWRRSRNEVTAEACASMQAVVAGLRDALPTALGIPFSLTVEVGANFSRLQSMAAAWGGHAASAGEFSRFSVHADYRADYFNLASENLDAAMSILSSTGNSEVMISLLGLAWRSFPMLAGGTVADALDLVSERGAWRLQLRVHGLLDGNDRALALSSAQGVLASARHRA
jgi:hypothetical protein